MRFAYSTLACPGRRLEETLELGAGAGYEGVELRLIDGELIDPGMSARERRRVAGACARAGLPIVAVDSSIRVAAAADPGGKRWHPEIDEPETALPQHLRLLRSWAAELEGTW
jgi:sugar phosphate isomerase/epimerase